MHGGYENEGTRIHVISLEDHLCIPAMLLPLFGLTRQNIDGHVQPSVGGGRSA